MTTERKEQRSEAVQTIGLHDVVRAADVLDQDLRGRDGVVVRLDGDNVMVRFVGRNGETCLARSQLRVLRPADPTPVEPTFRRLARNAVAGFVDGDDERYERAIESVQAACHEAYERGRRRESPSTTSQTILNTLKET